MPSHSGDQLPTHKLLTELDAAPTALRATMATIGQTLRDSAHASRYYEAWSEELAVLVAAHAGMVQSLHRRFYRHILCNEPQVLIAARAEHKQFRDILATLNYELRHDTQLPPLSEEADVLKRELYRERISGHYVQTLRQQWGKDHACNK